MSMQTYIKSAIKKLPILNGIVSELDKLHSEFDKLHSELIELKRKAGFVPPGHFYSPIPSLEEVQRDESRIFGSVPHNIIGLELHETEQLKLLNEFVISFLRS